MTNREDAEPEKSLLWWKCERCGKLIPYMADFCYKCADELLGESPKPFKPKCWYRCDRCGKDYLGDTGWCPNCGRNMSAILTGSERE